MYDLVSKEPRGSGRGTLYHSCITWWIALECTNTVILVDIVPELKSTASMNAGANGRYGCRGREVAEGLMVHHPAIACIYVRMYLGYN
jgi:hypothetical protein